MSRLGFTLHRDFSRQHGRAPRQNSFDAQTQPNYRYSAIATAALAFALAALALVITRFTRL